jgi:prepilin-type processing-associated H-X9-DG protein
LHLYASDNDGDIVPLAWARKKSGWPGPPDYPGWADAYFSDKQLLGPYTSNDQIYGRCRPGSLWHCPSDKGFRENRTSDGGSYGLCTKSYPWISKSKGWSRMWKLSRVRSGSKMLAFLDSTIPRFNPGYGKSPAFHGNIEPLPKNRPNKWRAGKPGCNYNHSMRHVNLTTNCSFIDGHVAKLDDLKESFDAGQFVIDYEER